MLGPALGGLLGAIGGGLIGGGEGALRGGGAGAAGGLQGREQAAAADLAEHTAQVEAASKHIEQREKLASGVRMILQSQPGLLAGEDPRLIGELAFPGSGLKVNPLLQLKLKNMPQANKNAVEALEFLIRQTDEPNQKAGYLSTLMDLQGVPQRIPRPTAADLQDPTQGLTGIDFDRYYVNGAEMADMAQSGNFPGFQFGTPRPDTRTRTIANEAIDALERLSALLRLDTNADATAAQVMQSQMDEKDNALINKHFPGVAGFVNPGTAVRVLRGIQDDTGFIGMVKEGGLEAPEQRVRDNFLDTIEAMEQEAATAERKNFEARINAHAAAIERENPELGDAEVDRRALEAAKQERRAARGGKIPERTR
ncbi:MAG: hypothetical protein ACYSUI_19055 [Planctomycetota bacterium]